MASINFILQGKGGVGKSLAALLLTQYFRKQGKKTVCYDTDPVNQTFTNVKSLGVVHLPILEGDEINSRNFDRLVEEIISIKDDAEVIIDNGAATFVPLAAYLVENQVIPFLIENGHQVTIHVVVVGGQGYRDTFNGLGAVIKHFPKTQIVVWQNEFFGSLKHGDKEFSETSVMKTNADSIKGIIALPTMRRDTFGKDIEEMLSKHQTFDQAHNDEKFSVMARQRLNLYSKQVFAAIEGAGL